MLRRSLLALMFFLPSATAQQQQPFTIRVDTQLVVETVVVKDKDGKNLEGLIDKDFTVTEDGVPQTISVFQFERLEDTPAPAPPPGAQQPAAELVQPKIPTQITPPAPGDSRYRDRRLLVLFFDLMNVSPADQLRAFTAADKFIRTQMKTPDLVAIMSFAAGSVKVLQDFTNDQEALFAVLEKLIYPDDNDNATADTTAAFGQDTGEFNIFNTDRQLAALQTAVIMLKPVNEQKSLVYFAGGLRLNGTDNQAQLRATINAAIRSNVAFFPVDARGLVATLPLGDATRPSPGGIGVFNGNMAMSSITNFQRSQDSLYALASDTGGKALLDNNDLAAGIVQAEQAITSYYVIGYYSSNTNLDGKFRRVKITLKETPTAKLDYRQGYYAGKTFNKFTAADKERQLEDALMLGDPITDLTIAMEVNYFQLNRAEYFVPITVKIPGSELVLARTGGAERTLIDFIGEVKDEYGTTIQNLRDKVDMKLSGETASELSRRPIEYDTGFTLLPGKYVIKFLARDSETGRIGTYQTPFVIPNLMKEDKRIPISSVVLSSQRVDMREALYNATKDKSAAAAAQAANPLVNDGQKLIPSVTRVFSKSREMFVYLQAYERNATTTEPLFAFVTFYRGQTKAFETPPLEVADGLDPKSKALPLKFSLSLSKLPVGEYNCQVTVLSPSGQKVAFWQSPVMLVN
ncbi:MAG: VWA domain-containing protein [Acidobacteria bacterium]|nr:MAG: VWA domain-containing protein [Acidobacteriota bacterium]